MKRQWLAGTIKRLRKTRREFRREAAIGLMAEECIGECRRIIYEQLGVGAAIINGFGASPFFDDLIQGLVNRMNLLYQQWSTAQSTSTGGLVTGAATTGTAASTSQTITAWLTAANTATGAITSALTNHVGYPPEPQVDDRGIFYKVRSGRPCRVDLPDGTVIEVNEKGAFSIKDSAAKIVYQANRVRPFNKFVNASDLLEDFIRFCGREAQVRRQPMLEIPIKLFICWLVLEAAKADEEPAPKDIKLIPDLRKIAKPHCHGCGRFISPAMAERKIEFCGAACFNRAMEKADDDRASKPAQTAANDSRANAGRAQAAHCAAAAQGKGQGARRAKAGAQGTQAGGTIC